jgi:hypothetical protein
VVVFVNEGMFKRSCTCNAVVFQSATSNYFRGPRTGSKQYLDYASPVYEVLLCILNVLFFSSEMHDNQLIIVIVLS